MQTVHFAACLVAAALVAHGPSAAQMTSAQGAAPAPGSVEPLDLRVVRASETAPREAQAAQAADAPSTGLSAPRAGPDKEYRVGPNDLLDVEVYDLDNLKRTVRVNAAGAISLPLIGAVNIAGLTSQEAEARIAERYREKYLQNPQVSVFIKEFTTERITVEGAVVKPGIFPLSGRITLLRALAMAGGFGPIADASEVMLFRVNDRQQREVAVYDVQAIRAGKSEDPLIRGDDLIVVKQDGTRKLLKDSVFRDVLDSINPFSVFSR